MNKIIIFTVGAFALLTLNGCVENSKKYKALQAELSDLNAANAAQTSEMDSLLFDLNEISAGIHAINEAEKILTLESSANTENGKNRKKQVAMMKSDLNAIATSIETYRKRVGELEGKNKRQSAEFKKLIASLNDDLEAKSEHIAELTKVIGEKEKTILAQTAQIGDLNKNVENLNQESGKQKETISKQDKEIHLANYLIGSKKELKEANVISRQGIFCPPIISSQAQNAKFVSVDMRETKSIPLNAKKAKVLSAHPTDSYTLDAAEDGMLTLTIKDEGNFWKQTKYLVVML